jgi:FixJ family two-component response regulator
MPVADASLLDAVKRAVERSRALRAADQSRSTALERFALLAPRERDIFAQVLEGRLNKQIASTLDCEEATVKVHRSRLMRKLGVRSLARLVRFRQEIGAA